MKYKSYILIALCSLFSFKAIAEESLLFVEAQSVIGYSSSSNEYVFYSHGENASMQQNSIGFDYIRKLSSENKEWGTAALQMRLGYNESKDEAELQIYNAYLKTKTIAGDFWAGHNRIAYGLSSYWDTHSDLLQPLSMQGIGYQRDWGIGYNKDLDRGNIKASISTGTAMPLRFNGNGIATLRGSYGILAEDNFSIGASLMSGEVLDTSGYNVVDGNEKDISLIGADFAYNYLNHEYKAEINIGKKNNKKAFGAFVRSGINLLEENRLKFEVQGAYTELEDIENYTIATGASYQITSDLSSKIMYERNDNRNDNRVIFQLYYYAPM